jgi:predicted nucleotidyltransferase
MAATPQAEHRPPTLLESVSVLLGGSDGMVASQEVRQTIQAILEKLLAGYAPQKVILFGSYAYGDPRPDSDIDLLIIKETDERFIDRWVAVRRLLSDPGRTIPLETLVLTPQELSDRLAIGDQFLAEVMEKGDVLYAG